MYYRQDALCHHGILGQKWGKKNGPPYPLNESDHSASEKKAGWKKSLDAEDERVKNERRESLKSVRGMTDADLQKAISRMQTEKKYRDLVEADIAPGKKYVTNIISSSGKKFATAAAAGAMAYGVKAAMTKKFDVKEAASYIATNPNKKK